MKSEFMGYISQLVSIKGMDGMMQDLPVIDHILAHLNMPEGVGVIIRKFRDH
ncbi:hypothetical protein D3C86_2074160 [compost metagenome]